MCTRIIMRDRKKNPYSAHVSLEFDRTPFPQRRTETIGTRYVVIEIKCNAFITIQHNITSHTHTYIYILFRRVRIVCSRPVVAPRETKFTRVKKYLGAHNIYDNINILYFTREISNGAFFPFRFIFYFISLTTRTYNIRGPKRFGDAICFYHVETKTIIFIITRVGSRFHITTGNNITNGLLSMLYTRLPPLLPTYRSYYINRLTTI